MSSTHCWDSPHLSIQRSPLLLEAGKGHVYEFPEGLSLCSQGHLEERKTGSVPTGAARGTALSQGYEPCRVWGTVPYLLLDGSCQQCAQLLLQLQALCAGTNLGSSVGAKRLQETVTLQKGGTAQGTSPPHPRVGTAVSHCGTRYLLLSTKGFIRSLLCSIPLLQAALQLGRDTVQHRLAPGHHGTHLQPLQRDSSPPPAAICHLPHSHPQDPSVPPALTSCSSAACSSCTPCRAASATSRSARRCPAHAS